jgi:2-polyprenyl-3-methyl-5-hydroxy-6-metoxy-1,4-benzoquinol methylase
MGSIQYQYHGAAADHTSSYLMQSVEGLLAEFKAQRILEIGCGNAANAARLSERYSIVGIDPSETGVRIAKAQNPNLRIEIGTAYEDLRARFGTFDTVLSLEVIEHLYDPREFLRRAHQALEPGGHLVLSTPYHGYLKNLALALTGKLDGHFTALWDGGHIKFFSVKTLSQMMRESGFQPVKIVKCGRISPLAKSMLVAARRVEENGEQ